MSSSPSLFLYLEAGPPALVCLQIPVHRFQIFFVDPAAGAAGGLQKGLLPGFAGLGSFLPRFLEHPAKRPVCEAHGGLIPGAPPVEEDGIRRQSFQISG